MYAKTKFFKVKSIKGGVLTGWAAPENGPLCSEVMLFANETMVSAACADGYDADAARAGIRDGWCGFEICLSARHFVLAEELTLRCANTGSELFRLNLAEVSFADPVVKPVRSVEEILDCQLEKRYTDLTIFTALISRLAKTLDSEKFVEFAYRFMLRRKPDQAGLRDYSLLAKTDPMKLIHLLSVSEEYKNRNELGVLGPFSSEFPQLPIFE